MRGMLRGRAAGGQARLPGKKKKKTYGLPAVAALHGCRAGKRLRQPSLSSLYTVAPFCCRMML